MKLPVRTVSMLICAGALCLGQSGRVLPLRRPVRPRPRCRPARSRGARPKLTLPIRSRPRLLNQPPPIHPRPRAGEVRWGGGTPDAKPGSKPYIIGPLDVLDVTVWNDAHLSHIYDVSPDGTISMPLIGLVKADGLTQSELAASISEKLLTVLNSPEVNIQVLKVNSKKYYLIGGVIRPGEYPLTAETTVLDAIANCGGFHDFANKKKIRIVRKGVAKPFFFNYVDVSKGKHMEENIILQNGDYIIVDE